MRAPTPAPRLYAAYAAAFLAVTLLAGVWLRAAFLRPALLGPVSGAHLLHAHSHLAFFGWATPALLALLAAPLARPGRAAAGLRLHAHLMGAASLAAFLGFLAYGYNALTIAIATVHVALWWAVALWAWGALDAAPLTEQRYGRAALFFLLLAGAGAMVPGAVEARGITDGWVRGMAVQLFLTPFTAGWLSLGALLVLLRSLPHARLATPALWLVVFGVVPSAALHVLAPAPAAWIPLLGRAGTALVGLGSLLVAAEALRARGLAPLLRLAAAAALLKAAAELLVAAGVGAGLLGSRPLVIAYLHLVLLGMVTPALLAGLWPQRRHRAAAAAHAAGLALMLGALLALGAPPLLGAALAAGASPMLFYWLALAGGAVSAAALLALPAGAALRAVRRPGAGRPMPPQVGKTPTERRAEH